MCTRVKLRSLQFTTIQNPIVHCSYYPGYQLVTAIHNCLIIIFHDGKLHIIFG